MRKRTRYLAAALVILLLGLAVPLIYTHLADREAGRGDRVANPLPVETVASNPRDAMPDANRQSGAPPEIDEQPTTQKAAGAPADGSAASSDGASPPATWSKGRSADPSPPAPSGSSPASPSDQDGESEDQGQPASPGEGCRVEVAVVGRDGELLFGPARVTVAPQGKWGLSTLGALEATGLHYLTYDVYHQTSKYHNFVVSIEGQVNEGMAGWMYQVNGRVPLAAADREAIKPGDKVIWWYSRGMDAATPTWESLKAAAP